jgi:hypothetical protein
VTKPPFARVGNVKLVGTQKYLIATSKYYFVLRLMQERTKDAKLDRAEGLPSSGVPRCAISAFRASNRGQPKLVTS